jgi:hypothetical protein
MTDDVDLQPKLPLTVGLPFWQEMAGKTSVAFADSYLSGATMANRRLITKTNIAFDRVSRNFDAMVLMRSLGVTLVSPNGRVATAPPERKRIEPNELPMVRGMLAEIREAFDAKAARDRKLFRGVPSTQARTDGTGISADMRKLLGKPAPESDYRPAWVESEPLHVDPVDLIDVL